ncbi:MAG: hypothetical protein R3A79_24720 [Nannocystaceae bacterium]
MHPTRAWLLAFVATTQLTGFFCVREPEGPEPCEMDPLGCAPPAELELDPDCARTDPLVVQLGQGESTYAPLTGGPVEVHYGFQGGQHFFLGVAVDNPALGSPGLEITFTIRGALECDLEAAAGACDPWTDFGARTLVVADPSLWTVVDGALETTGYLVVLDEDPDWWAYERWGRIDVRAEVRDACDRRGSVDYSYILGDGGATSGSTSDGSTSG